MPKPMTEEDKKRRTKKVQALRRLAENIQRLRNNVTRDLSSDDEKTALTALVVAIIDRTAERVGNESSAKEGHFGVTGLRKKHVAIKGNQITLDYVGKSGVKHEKCLSDEKIAGMLRKLMKRTEGGTDLFVTEDGFRIKADKVNRYLKDFDVTAKDLRGYSANDRIVTMLKNTEVSKDEKERKKRFQEVLKSTAEAVGHQKATLKQHYLLPGIEEDYVKKGKIRTVKEASEMPLRPRRGGALVASVVARLAEQVADARLVTRLELKRIGDDYMRAEAREAASDVRAAYERVFGEQCELPTFKVAVDNGVVPEGKVALFDHPKPDRPHGLLVLSTKAFCRPGYLAQVLRHELAHASLGPDQEPPHGDAFQRLAEALGIEPEYRD